MSGRGTISVNQSPQYGDKKALEQASKATTVTPMTNTPIPAPSAGRPQVRGQEQSAPATAAQATQQAQVDPEHEAMFAALASAFRTHQFWQNVLAQYPSEWSRMYAKEATRAYEMLQQRVRANTPYFE